MTMKSDANFVEKNGSDLENDIRNFANFHRFKKGMSILESKMVELNQNQNSKQSYQKDVVWKFFLTLGINE